MRKTIATLAALVSLALPASALGYGEDYDLLPINSGPGTVDVPALPDKDAAGNPLYRKFFWAGTCDRGAVTGLNPGDPIPGGVGQMPSTVAAIGNPVANVAPPSTHKHCIDWQMRNTTVPSSLTMWNTPPQWRLAPVTQAGAHADGTTTFAFDRVSQTGYTDNIVVKLPPGFVADPNAIAKCSAEQFDAIPYQCPPESQVGVLNLRLNGDGLVSNGGQIDAYTSPVYNLEPRKGNVAELGLVSLTSFSVLTNRVVAKARTNGDMGVTAFVGQVPNPLPVHAQSITLWGVPWAAHNDVWRAPAGLNQAGGSDPIGGCTNQPGSNVNDTLPASGLPAHCQQHYQPSWGEVKPFVSLETDCNPAPVTRLLTDAYQFPGDWTSDGRPEGEKLGFANADPNESDGDWKRADSPAPPVTGCEKLPFEPSITLDPVKQGDAENKATDSPTGLDVELRIPQNNDLPFKAPPQGAPQPEVDQYVADAFSYWSSDAGLATAHLKDTVVTLAEGMTLNPSAADGLAACSMDQIGVTDTNSPVPPKVRFNNAEVKCPDASKIADVVVETPLLDESDWPTGNAYIAQQGNNPFNTDFALYIAIESKERGFIAKLAGKVELDPSTGRLTTTFAENPELPFDVFRLKFKAGPRAPLATPATCGTHTHQSSLTSHAQPGSPVGVSDPFQVDSSPAGGCPASKSDRPFDLGFSAGSTEILGGAHTPFTLRLTRGDGRQELDRVQVTTPEGFAAKLAGVPYCPEPSIAQAISRTATGDGALEKASPSCPEASRVGTTTIGAGAGSQPFYVKGNVYLAGPYKGAPISLAFVVPAVAGPFDLGVQVVRTALNVNPKTAQVTATSDPIPQILRGVPLRLRDIRVDVDRPGFTLNPTDCAEQLVSAKVSGASGASADLSNRFQIAECARLAFKPKLTLKLRGGTERADYQGLKATLTARPGDANIARAAVTMPRSAFLAQEHIRTVCTRVQFAADACPKGSIYGKASATTPLLDAPLSGPVYLRSSDNKLPDLVVALKGPDTQPIEVELSGRTDSVKGALRNTFDVVPDAPVTKFTLELFGGKKGLIVNSQDLCAKLHKATVRFGAQNGRERNFRPVVRNGCTRKQMRKAKRR